ncbi:aminotransferase class V-fold PLP-dependent enzyme [Halodesulfovibrio aestuarii]|uniref:aminotransferase class V-fold PLP-dependent enzyme n=1 Tax=Halodesulfovibrio aestuarii TaxID=126333 RepID=UPI0004006F43
MNNIPKEIDIETHRTEQSGSLSVIQANTHLNFPIRRVYYIHSIEDNKARGFHGHKKLQQCIVATSGSVTLSLEGYGKTYSFELNSPDKGVLVPAGYWREMSNFSKDAVLMVIASDDYDPEDYIHDKEVFNTFDAERSAINKITYLAMHRRYDEFKLQLQQVTEEVLDEVNYIMGPRLEKFEESFAKFTGAKYCIGTGNGLDALEIILRASNIGAGDEVIVSAGGFIATLLAVMRVGATPVLVECETWGNIDPLKIEAAITKNTKAILPTHLYGIPADMDGVRAVANKYDLLVFEDACQAHGAQYKDGTCGALSDAAAFSFYPTKNLGGFGDGGCLTTSSEKIAKTARQLRSYGAAVKYHHDIVGFNSRLDEMQAALLQFLLPNVPKWNEKRRNLASLYLNHLSGIEEIELPMVSDDSVPVWHVFPIMVPAEKRDAFCDHLTKHNIGYNIHYPKAMHLQPCCSHLQHNAGDFPVAEKLADCEVSLPLDPYHTEEEINFVIKAILDFFMSDTVKN